MDVARSTFLVMAGLLLVSGCGVDKGVAARVGDREIDLGEIQAYLGAVTGLSWPAVDGRAAQQLLDQYLDQEVIVAAAGGQEDVTMPADPALRTATVRSLATEVCGLPPQPSTEEIKRAIAGEMAEIRPARARVRQMLVDSLAEAQQVRDRLDNGEPFFELSKEVSRAPNADAGGGLGLLSRGTLPEELDSVVFDLAEGEISAPVASPAGYHVFQVLEVVPEGPPERAEVELAVKRELADQLSRDFTRRCVASTAQKVGVAVYPENLWFDYQGRYGESADDA
jgi:hypothetical protein